MLGLVIHAVACLIVLRVDSKHILAHELSHHVNGCLKVTAGVVTQVKNQVFHPLRLQLLQCLTELGECLLRKTLQLDVTGLLVHHEIGFHTMDRNLVPGDGEMKRLRLASTPNVNRNLGAFFPTQFFEHPSIGADFTDSNTVINTYDLVTSTDANPLGRPALYRLDNDNGVLHDLELHTYAVKISLQRLIHAAHLLFGDIDRMRIKLFEHLNNRLVNQFFKIGRIHIIITDILHQTIHLLRIGFIGAVALGINRSGTAQEAGQKQSTAKKFFHLHG